ncbi:hypothetical protein [Micromonospora profundi]|uniref:hypothetical protein n=1 Tax=Micromonospora profundi TaxID=1420889 RepID=UPI003A916AB1
MSFAPLTASGMDVATRVILGALHVAVATVLIAIMTRTAARTALSTVTDASDTDEISADGKAGMAHFGRSTKRRNLDDHLNGSGPPCYHQQGRVSTPTKSSRAPHDFAGALRLAHPPGPATGPDIVTPARPAAGNHRSVKAGSSHR